MRTVLMVLFDQVQSLDVTGPLEVFAGANTWRTQDGDGPAYDIRTASLGGEMVRTRGLRIRPTRTCASSACPAGRVDPRRTGWPWTSSAASARRRSASGWCSTEST